jgi:hypothetical protein
MLNHRFCHCEILPFGIDDQPSNTTSSILSPAFFTSCAYLEFLRNPTSLSSTFSVSFFFFGWEDRFSPKICGRRRSFWKTGKKG